MQAASGRASLRFVKKAFKAQKGEKAMIKLYGIKSCPECSGLYEQVKDDERFEIIDVSQHILLLKEFLSLRDNDAAFDEARNNGYAGLPCFVLEDGSVTFSPEELGLKSCPLNDEIIERLHKEADELRGTY
jgi:glutaredoxin-related protein